MRALAIWKAVAKDEANFLEALVEALERLGIRYCVIGGQAVNAYAEPLVSLDLDLAVAVEQVELLAAELQRRFRVERFPHSVDVSAPGSNLRVQIQTDPRYSAFVGRAAVRDVLGLRLPVAAAEDVLDGKVWAALDPPAPNPLRDGGSRARGCRPSRPAMPCR